LESIVFVFFPSPRLCPPTYWPKQNIVVPHDLCNAPAVS
jgi:hypothetical protein